MVIGPNTEFFDEFTDPDALLAINIFYLISSKLIYKYKLIKL